MNSRIDKLKNLDMRDLETLAESCEMKANIRGLFYSNIYYPNIGLINNSMTIDETNLYNQWRKFIKPELKSSPKEKRTFTIKLEDLTEIMKIFQDGDYDGSINRINFIITDNENSMEIIPIDENNIEEPWKIVIEPLLPEEEETNNDN